MQKHPVLVLCLLLMKIPEHVVHVSVFDKTETIKHIDLIDNHIYGDYNTFSI